jgi:hypothetical protein
VSIIQILNCVFTKMSCGNRFQCGLKKVTRSSFQPDKPSNPELHGENQKRLNDLLKAREEMDRGFTTVTPPALAEPLQQQGHAPPIITTFSSESAPAAQTTPWKVPSALDYEKKNK